MMEHVARVLMAGILTTLLAVAVLYVVRLLAPHRGTHKAPRALGVPEPFWPFEDDPRFGSMILASEVALSPGARRELHHEEEWWPLPASGAGVDVSWWPREPPGPGIPPSPPPGPGPILLPDPGIGESCVDALLRGWARSDGPRAWFARQIAETASAAKRQG